MTNNIAPEFLAKAEQLVDTEAERLRKVKIENLARELQRQANDRLRLLPTDPAAIEARIAELKAKKSEIEARQVKNRRNPYYQDEGDALRLIEGEIYTLEKANPYRRAS